MCAGSTDKTRKRKQLGTFAFAISWCENQVIPYNAKGNAKISINTMLSLPRKTKAKATSTFPFRESESESAYITIKKRAFAARVCFFSNIPKLATPKPVGDAA